MPARKQPHKGALKYPGGLIQVTPAYHRTQKPPPKFPGHKTSLPAIQAVGPDGREWYVTFESPMNPDELTLEGYIRRMRMLGQAIMEHASKLESELTQKTQDR